MLTFNLDKDLGKPLYVQVYQHLKNAILQHQLAPQSKLPSKRALATQLGLSNITIENAYGQLLAEGYIYSKQKSGYFVAIMDNDYGDLPLENIRYPHFPTAQPQQHSPQLWDLSSNNTAVENFPLQTWAKLLRQVLSNYPHELLTKAPAQGILELRQAISLHLFRFRGMEVNPEQIVIGAGTEYLYELLIKLLGRNKIYCIEDPGYQKISQIYNDAGAKCLSLPIDNQGLAMEQLNHTYCDVLHLSPSHHFPTGIITPANRRYELLNWANSHHRYIIEDDYDTEFRLTGKPIPSLFSMDYKDSVIYMNTFTKSLTATIRISYLVLPRPLLQIYQQHYNYLSCTVSTFEQYTLAAFIQQCYFERHINRMRNRYKKLRQQLQKALTQPQYKKLIEILPQASGLYFLLQLNTSLNDKELESRLALQGLRLQSLQNFYSDVTKAPSHIFVMNYSSINPQDIPKIIESLVKSLQN